VEDVYDVNDYSDEASALALLADHIAQVVGENVVNMPTTVRALV
jgi:hypothetical protein